MLARNESAPTTKRGESRFSPLETSSRKVCPYSGHYLKGIVYPELLLKKIVWLDFQLNHAKNKINKIN